MTRGRSGPGSTGSGKPLLTLDLTETYVFLGGKGRAEAVPLTEALWDEMADQTGDGALGWVSARSAGEPTEQQAKRPGEQVPRGEGPVAKSSGSSKSGAGVSGESTTEARLPGSHQPGPNEPGVHGGESRGPGPVEAASNGRGAQEAGPERRSGTALRGDAPQGAAHGAESHHDTAHHDAARQGVAYHGAAHHGAPLHGEGWYVSAYWLEADMATWERHATGDRLIIAQSGAFTLLLDHQDGQRDHVALKAAGSVLVPSCCWHRLTVEIPGMVLFITPSHGTEHRLA